MKYHTTKIDPEQTCGEIAALVRKVGGESFAQTWDQQGYLGSVNFANPSRIQSELECDWDRAYRVAWRQTKHLIEGLIISIESGVTDAHTAFMGYVMVDGLTMSDRLKTLGADGLLQLTADDEEEVVVGEFVDG